MIAVNLAVSMGRLATSPNSSAIRGRSTDADLIDNP
jgi:hypothetical protein